MGMDDLMLSCIRALAENRIQDAKQAAIACCVNDTTKKNAGKTGYYKKLLENGTTTLFELPANLKGLILMQDVSGFNITPENSPASAGSGMNRPDWKIW